MQILRGARGLPQRQIAIGHPFLRSPQSVGILPDIKAYLFLTGFLLDTAAGARKLFVLASLICIIFYLIKHNVYRKYSKMCYLMSVGVNNFIGCRMGGYNGILLSFYCPQCGHFFL